MVLCIVALGDIKERKIKNIYPILILIMGCVQMMLGAPPTLISRIVGSLCVSGSMLVIDVLRPGAFGGGDIKLMAAGGVFLGDKKVWNAMIIAILLAAVYSIGLLSAKRTKKDKAFAFGPFLCLGMGIVSIFEII